MRYWGNLDDEILRELMITLLNLLGKHIIIQYQKKFKKLVNSIISTKYVEK